MDIVILKEVLTHSSYFFLTYLLTYFSVASTGGSADGNGHLLNEANSIHRSSQMVDSYLNIGKNTLSELYSQSNRFKVHFLLVLLAYALMHSLTDCRMCNPKCWIC